MFACSDPDREGGKGHAQTFVYRRIPFPPEGDGKVGCLVGEVCIIYLTPLCRWVY